MRRGWGPERRQTIAAGVVGFWGGRRAPQPQLWLARCVFMSAVAAERAPHVMSACVFHCAVHGYRGSGVLEVEWIGGPPGHPCFC